MPVWQVVLLVNLTLAVGLGLGYADWGRRADRLSQELEATRARVEQLERERAACTTGARAGEQQWEARGIVRAIFPRADSITAMLTTPRRGQPLRSSSRRTRARWPIESSGCAFTPSVPFPASSGR